jgi:hypothetical protein
MCSFEQPVTLEAALLREELFPHWPIPPPGKVAMCMPERWGCACTVEENRVTARHITLCEEIQIRECLAIECDVHHSFSAK